MMTIHQCCAQLF